MFGPIFGIHFPLLLILHESIQHSLGPIIVPGLTVSFAFTAPTLYFISTPPEHYFRSCGCLRIREKEKKYHAAIYYRLKTANVKDLI